MIHADTDGLLDRCHCGAVAGFEFKENALLRKFQARCSDCCEQTDRHWCKFDAATAWNLARRAERGGAQ